MTVDSLCGNCRCRAELYPQRPHTVHSAPPDHDVNELGHQVWEEEEYKERNGERERERGQTVTEHGTNMCVRALALRLPHFDMLHICLTPHVTKSPRHEEEVAGGGEEIEEMLEMAANR